MLGGLIGGALKGIGGGLLGKGGGLLKNLGGGKGGGLLKGLAGGGKGGGGLLGKVGELGKGFLEKLGGPQGIMDMVQQFTDLAGAGGGEGADGAGAAEGGGAAKGGAGAKGNKAQAVFARLLKRLNEAKSPEEVEKIVGKLKEKVAGQDPQLGQLFDKIAQAKLQDLGVKQAA